MRKGSRIVLTVIFASVILFLIICPIVNDISARRIIADIESVPLPQDTQMAEQFSQTGNIILSIHGETGFHHFRILI